MSDNVDSGELPAITPIIFVETAKRSRNQSSKTSQLATCLEQVSGYPMPELYNQYYINQYSFPRRLHSQKRDLSQRRNTQPNTLYDLSFPKARKGVSGWKLISKAPPITNGLGTQANTLMRTFCDSSKSKPDVHLI